MWNLNKQKIKTKTKKQNLSLWKQNKEWWLPEVGGEKGFKGSQGTNLSHKMSKS